MSFFEDLSSLIQKYPYKTIIDETNEADVGTAKKCKKILKRVIKKKLNEKTLNHKEEIDLNSRVRTKCYICKANMKNQAHPFYDSMCVSCGDFNFQMRNKKKDLTGQTAIVTGGRIKIGHEIALWLLRNNCSVIVTTRFPTDALFRYQKLSDYESFKDRLFIYGVDFRNLKKVYEFIHYVQNNFKQINILINNATQTLYQNDQYLLELLQNEEKAMKAIQNNLNQESVKESDNNIVPLIDELASFRTVSFNEQSPEEQVKIVQENFPIYDINYLPVDTKNSWNKELEEISFGDFAETQVINSWVPFILCSKLKKLMIPIAPNKKSFIINLSAMEGKFNYKNKLTKHPQTNMAKVALNMMTRTCGAYYAKDNIYMTCIDTGWCLDMRPGKEFCHEVPLDDVDGAMRILQPIYDDLDLHSVFLKDFKEVTW